MAKFFLCISGAAIAMLANFPGDAAEPVPDEELSGGSTTVFQDGQNAFAIPLANLSRENRRAHVVGNSFFNKNWVVAPASPTARDGLGPLFHTRSCSGCHLRDGRGAPPAKGELPTALLFRLSIPGASAHGAPLPDPIFGAQLATQAIPGVEPEGTVSIEYDSIEGSYADGTKYTLEKPIYTLVPSPAYAAPHPDILLGPRIASPLHGLGLLEAVPEATILSHADPDDKDRDGISGRPNHIWNPETQTTELGRFGWKANQPDIRQQTAAAFLSDIGITSSIHPKDDLTASQVAALPPETVLSSAPELEDRILDRVVRYSQTLAPPARRNWKDATVQKGRDLFHAIGCIACHLPELKTAPDYSDLPEVAGQIIRPYTDLLLHDMGPDLDDDRPDFEATGSEWRTPPLWGIGLTQAVNGHTRFLHDGRARNLEEAILWHGGEADAAKTHYLNLSSADREALLTFLNSL